MIPLYGFLEGDTLGVLIFAYDNDTVDTLTKRLQRAAAVRVAPPKNSVLVYGGSVQNPMLTLAKIGISALERFDVKEMNDEPRTSS